MSYAPISSPGFDDVWRWLPVFRAVAEAESVSAGAEALHVTPPAVSRSLRLLQDAVGVALIERSGRGIRLTRAGKRLLEAARRAHAVVEEGLAEARGAAFTGALRVASPAALAAGVIRGLVEVQSSYPELRPEVRDHPRDDVPDRLLRGDLDLAVTFTPRAHAELRVHELTTQKFGVYCGRSHELFESTLGGLDVLARHPFVAAAPTLDGELEDVWPVAWPRLVALSVSDLAIRLGLCITQPLLAVLPITAVDAHVEAGRVRRIATPPLPERRIYAMRRRAVTPGDAIDDTIEAIRKELAS